MDPNISTTYSGPRVERDVEQLAILLFAGRFAFNTRAIEINSHVQQFAQAFMRALDERDTPPTSAYEICEIAVEVEREMTDAGQQACHTLYERLLDKYDGARMPEVIEQLTHALFVYAHSELR